MAEGISFRTKSVLYKTIYSSTLLTGMTSFYMTNTDYERVEKEATNKARKVLRRQAVEKLPGGKYRKLTNREVLK